MPRSKILLSLFLLSIVAAPFLGVLVATATPKWIFESTVYGALFALPIIIAIPRASILNKSLILLITIVFIVASSSRIVTYIQIAAHIVLPLYLGWAWFHSKFQPSLFWAVFGFQFAAWWAGFSVHFSTYTYLWHTATPSEWKSVSTLATPLDTLMLYSLALAIPSFLLLFASRCIQVRSLTNRSMLSS